MDKIKKSKAKKVRREASLSSMLHASDAKLTLPCVREQDDLAPPAKLRPDAIKVLYETSKFFLESAFNRESASQVSPAAQLTTDTTRYSFLRFGVA